MYQLTDVKNSKQKSSLWKAPMCVCMCAFFGQKCSYDFLCSFKIFLPSGQTRKGGSREGGEEGEDRRSKGDESPCCSRQPDRGKKSSFLHVLLL